MSERHTIQYERLDAGGLKIKTNQRFLCMRTRRFQQSLGDGCVGVITEWPAPEYQPKHARFDDDQDHGPGTVLWSDQDCLRAFVRIMARHYYQVVLPRPTYYPWRATLR